MHARPGHLAGLTLKRADRPGSIVGPLLENFVLGELARQLTWTTELGDRMVAGVVLYCGTQSLPFGDRLRALPLSALWTT